MEDAEIGAELKRGSGYADLPGRHLTPNQIVAWNVAYFRNAAGLTQDELGERMGWSKAIVSAAERSWDGARVRQFSADDIVTICTALRLPIGAMFLPPEDDGVDVRYLIDVPVERGPGGGTGYECTTMHDLMLHIVPDEDFGQSEDGSGDTGGNDPVGKRYWNRYVTAINSYLRADRVGELAEYIEEDIGTEERIIEHLDRLRSQYDALREMISDNDHLQQALYDRLGDMRTERRRPAPRDPVQDDEP